MAYAVPNGYSVRGYLPHALTGHGVGGLTTTVTSKLVELHRGWYPGNPIPGLVLTHAPGILTGVVYLTKYRWFATIAVSRLARAG